MRSTGRKKLGNKDGKKSDDEKNHRKHTEKSRSVLSCGDLKNPLVPITLPCLCLLFLFPAIPIVFSTGS